MLSPAWLMKNHLFQQSTVAECFQGASLPDLVPIGLQCRCCYGVLGFFELLQRPCTLSQHAVCLADHLPLSPLVPCLCRVD